MTRIKLELYRVAVASVLGLIFAINIMLILWALAYLIPPVELVPLVEVLRNTLVFFVAVALGFGAHMFLVVSVKDDVTFKLSGLKHLGVYLVFEAIASLLMGLLLFKGLSASGVPDILAFVLVLVFIVVWGVLKYTIAHWVGLSFWILDSHERVLLVAEWRKSGW